MPGSSGSMPGRAFFSMASACSGMSGRLQASGAGERSSVLVSPVTLNTVTVRLSGTSGREVNHSASAQDCMTALALALPALSSGQRLHVVEKVEHQQRVLQGLGRRGTAFAASQQIDQGLDVEAAQHGAQQFGRPDLGNQRARLFALGDLRQELGLDLRGVVHACRHAVGDEIDEESFLARGRIFQQANETGGLLRGQRQRRNP